MLFATQPKIANSVSSSVSSPALCVGSSDQCDGMRVCHSCHVVSCGVVCVCVHVVAVVVVCVHVHVSVTLCSFSREKRSLEHLLSMMSAVSSIFRDFKALLDFVKEV